MIRLEYIDSTFQIPLQTRVLITNKRQNAITVAVLRRKYVKNLRTKRSDIRFALF